MPPQCLECLDPPFTHFNVFLSTSLAETVEPFLDGEEEAPQWSEHAAAR